MDDEFRDYQFELAGVRFGIGRLISVDESGFDPGSSGPAGGEIDLPESDVTLFGRERVTSPTWGFQLHTDQTWNARDALAEAARLAVAWRNEKQRYTQGGEISWLRYHLAGRTRRLPGHPRNFSAPPDNLLLGGKLPIVCDFKASVPLTFDDLERERTIGIVSTSEGGFIAPFTMPLTPQGPPTSRPSAISQADAGGEVPAYFTASIKGPILNPKITGNGWQLEFVENIPAGSTLEVSTYPWDSFGLVDGVRPALMTYRSRFTQARINHLGEELRFGGVDSTGTSKAVVKWRPAYVSY